MDLESRAQALISRLSMPRKDFGFMSVAIYDTAWLSMISKPSASGPFWLYPQCFEFIMNKQSPDGGWESYASPIDGVLNTAASLLALKMHEERPLQIPTPSSDQVARSIALGSTSLQTQLQRWDVSATVHVGFEYLVPNLLTLLADKGINFDFPGRASLMELRDTKMAKFDPRYLYSEHKLTALHSLEAFFGKIDFNKVQHHKHAGSFMASPSSTAAYLMSIDQWDDEAEAYLDSVLKSGAGQGSGGAPSAFPSTYFEATWALTTLLKNGFDYFDLGTDNIEYMGDLLHSGLDRQGGCLGFAPSIQPDVDDTSKALVSLALMEKPRSAQALLDRFENASHFKTYAGERNPSFSANCNALVALLSEPDVAAFESSMEKATRFLCDTWWETDGWIEDKWNLSQYYSTMLMAEAFSELIKAWDQGKLTGLPYELMRDRVVICLFQAMVRTVLTQNKDGSWGTIGSQEETAYGALIVSKAAILPDLEPLQKTLESTLDAAKDFIQTQGQKPPSYLWVEKVSYGSEILCESYMLAALKARVTPSRLTAKMGSLISIPHDKVAKFVKFYSRMPLFEEAPKSELCMSLMEGYLFLPQLSDLRLNVFPRDGMEEDKYFEYIPFTWTSNNNRKRAFTSSRSLQDMMIISFLNYQADEYMETTVGRNLGHQKQLVLAMVDEVMGETSGRLKENDTTAYGRHSKAKTQSQNGLATPDASSSDEDDDQGGKAVAPSTLKEVHQVLNRFTGFVLQHPRVQASSSLAQAGLKTELRRFLEAHMEQTEDSSRFAAQPQHGHTGATFDTPRTSFYRWVQSTSSDHTSCPYSFAFYKCAISANGKDCFPSVQQEYIAESLCRHLAVMCRMYNDYGSVARDRDEANLNSVNFPDYAIGDVEGGGREVDDLKARLFALATYERESVDMVMRSLWELAGDDREQKRTLERLQVFCDVTDLFGQIYVARDIASRM